MSEAAEASAATSPEPSPSGRAHARVVARGLRQQIQAGDLAPGEWMREIKLAEELGASRATIREALRLLERDGLVQIEKFRGARVSAPSPYELFDHFEIRAALFGLAARFACFRAPDSALAEIVARIRALVRTAAQQSAKARFEEGVEIGSLISLHASPDARAMLATSHRKARWHFSVLGLDEGGAIGPLDDWHALGEALAERRAEPAADAARRIIYFNQQEVTKALLARGEGGRAPG